MIIDTNTITERVVEKFKHGNGGLLLEHLKAKFTMSKFTSMNDLKCEHIPTPKFSTKSTHFQSSEYVLEYEISSLGTIEELI